MVVQATPVILSGGPGDLTPGLPQNPA
jgi:hypothetical protein